MEKRTELPFSVELLAGDEKIHRHDMPEIYLVLDGQLELEVGGEQYRLNRGDFLLVNGRRIHRTAHRGGYIVALQLDLSFFERALHVQLPRSFRCSSVEGAAPELTARMRALLVRYLRQALSAEPQVFEAAELALATIRLLESTFAMPETGGGASEDMAAHIQNAVSFMHIHYAENLGVHALAQHCHLADAYLSRIFKAELGMGPAEYWRRIRLEQAQKLLTSTKLPLSHIAAACGFSSARAFSQLFRRSRGISPADYRQSVERLPGRPPAKADILDLLTALEAESAPAWEAERQVFVELSAQAPGRDAGDSPFELIALGHADSLLQAEIQAAVRQVQTELGFRFGHIGGVFDATVLRCVKTSEDSIFCDFSRLDAALDFLLSVGLRPFVELSFVPDCMASSQAELYCRQHSGITNTSMPKSLALWTALIRGFLEHIQARYGTAEIRRWKFTPWHFPEHKKRMHQGDSVADLLSLYAGTWAVFKEFDPQLSLGATTMLPPETPEQARVFRQFFGFCRGKQKMPDFLCFHMYPLDLQKGEGAVRVDPSGKVLARQLEIIQTEAAPFFPEGTKIFVTEWNSAPIAANLLNDLPYNAACVVASLMHCREMAEGFAWSMVSEQMELIRTSQEEFHGGAGLLTGGGIRKPSYYAYLLLKLARGEQIGQGDCWVLSREEKTLRLLLWNPAAYYSRLELKNSYDNFLHTVIDAYVQNFSRQGRMDLRLDARSEAYRGSALHFRLALSGLEKGDYVVTEREISCEHGNPFEVWRAAGANECLTREEAAYVDALSQPALRRQQIPARGGALVLSRTVQPNGLLLVELRPSRA